jgi:hypothetical protein
MCVIKYHARGKTGQNDLRRFLSIDKYLFWIDDQGVLIASYRPPN